MVGRIVRAAAMAAVGVGVLGLGACGSITRGTSEKMAFQTEPAGAMMTSTKGYACPATPCSLDVDRSDEFDVTFAKPGFRPETIPVRTKVVGTGAAGMAGNVIAGGIIGIGVDAATGAAFDHFPNPVVATLVPDSLPSAQRERRHRGRPGV
ncbi:translation initiation factor 2 [Methylobacterium sp. Leaf106]|nr:translation initiation factor 2 [Methylobacterium sp. Leaf106]